MDIDWLRRCCRLPHVTESVQWGDNLVFKVAGKIFAIAALEPAGVCLSFKCSPEDFAELAERPGIIPAPYLARAHWVALEHEDALPAAELKRRLRTSYDLVLAALPKRIRAGLS
ncbi:MAG: MmcQ/YjbR family DNA-binding protein [Acidobacteriia bacterium]|nr:MmcQ/YjbR family DNA-binding protein [Terriglobia bacterium]